MRLYNIQMEANTPVHLLSSEHMVQPGLQAQLENPEPMDIQYLHPETHILFPLTKMVGYTLR